LAVAVATIFIFVIGVALGSVPTYITTYIIKAVQSPPPAGLTAGARVAK
jgi:hypothetical protein